MAYKDEQLILLKDYSRRECHLFHLLQKNFNMHTQDKNGLNVLHYAVHYEENLDVLSILENNILDVNKPMQSLDTSLHIACRSGNTHIIELLLKFKAKPNLQNREGETPFFLLDPSVDYLNSELIKKHNIDLNIYDRNGVTLFNHIVRKGAINTINSILADKELCNTIAWNTGDNNNNNLITSLIRSHQPKTSNNKEYDKILKKFMHYGVSINHINTSGKKPVIEAIKYHNPEMVELLNNNGADLSCVNSEKQTLGAYLNEVIIQTNHQITNNQSYSNHSREKEQLAQLTKIEEYIQKEKLYTPSITDIKAKLKSNISSKDMDDIKKAYTKYISVSNDKQTLLDYCLFVSLDPREPKIQIANFFIKNGANINSELIHTNIIEYHNYESLPMFLYAAQNCNKECSKLMHYMLKNNYDPTNDAGDNNYNALHYMATKIIYSKSNLAEEIIIKEMLKTTININQQSDEGVTPFELLLNNNNLEKRFNIIELFLEKQPDFSLKNKKGISVYEQCVSALNNLTFPSNSHLINTKQELLSKIEMLALEQSISQMQTSKRSTLKI